MNIWYIKQITKSKEMEGFCPKAVLEKIIFIYKVIFKIIKVERIKDKTICTIPTIKAVKKLNKILYKNDIENIILSKQLNQIEDFKNRIFNENINILNGRLLFNYLAYDTIRYVLKNKNRKLETAEISILVNDNTYINTQNIIHIAKKVKTVNIITNNISKFQEVENYLYEELGIMIRVSNNTKKILLKSDIILNIDMPTEILNKYNLPHNGIIINLNNKIQINSKRFNGINISYFKITIPKKYKMEDFENEIMYESIIYNIKEFNKVRELIKKDNIKLDKLIGNNGQINEKEFANN